MRRKSLYSRATRRRTSMPTSMGDGPYVAPVWADPPPPLRKQLLTWWKGFAGRHDRSLPAVAAALAVLALLGGWRLLHPIERALTQWDIDNAVKYTLSHTDAPPAETAIAANTVAPSVVRVEGYLSPEHAAEEAKAEAAEAKKNKNYKPVPLHIPDGKEEEKPDATGTG